LALGSLRERPQDHDDLLSAGFQDSLRVTHAGHWPTAAMGFFGDGPHACAAKRHSVFDAAPIFELLNFFCGKSKAKKKTDPGPPLRSKTLTYVICMQHSALAQTDFSKYNGCGVLISDPFAKFVETVINKFVHGRNDIFKLLPQSAKQGMLHDD
jgi:hypothetical protein